MAINMPMSIMVEACAAKWTGITYCPEPSPHTASPENAARCSSPPAASAANLEPRQVCSLLPLGRGEDAASEGARTVVGRAGAGAAVTLTREARWRWIATAGSITGGLPIRTQLALPLVAVAGTLLLKSGCWGSRSLRMSVARPRKGQKAQYPKALGKAARSTAFPHFHRPTTGIQRDRKKKQEDLDARRPPVDAPARRGSLSV